MEMAVEAVCQSEGPTSKQEIVTVKGVLSLKLSPDSEKARPLTHVKNTERQENNKENKEWHTRERRGSHACTEGHAKRIQVQRQLCSLPPTEEP